MNEEIVEEQKNQNPNSQLLSPQVIVEQPDYGAINEPNVNQNEDG